MHHTLNRTNTCCTHAQLCPFDRDSTLSVEFYLWLLASTCLATWTTRAAVPTSMKAALPRQHARSRLLTRTLACTDEMAAESAELPADPGTASPDVLSGPYKYLSLHGTLYKYIARRTSKAPAQNLHIRAQPQSSVATAVRQRTNGSRRGAGTDDENARHVKIKQPK